MINTLLIGFAGFICVYAIVDRICKCCEQCATAKSFGKYCAEAEKAGGKVVISTDNCEK